MFKNRKHSKIDKLPSSIKEAVEQMILNGDTYSEIVEYIKSNDLEISIASVCRYAKSLNANLMKIKMVQENFRALNEQLEKYPEMDTTGAIIRLASHSMLESLQNTDKEKWAEVSPDKIIRNVAGLVRASAYKSKIDLENKETWEQGFDAVKDTVFLAMQKENPDLYKQVAEFLDSKKEEKKESEE